ncbi:hypothetical protein MMC31_000549 [Peltigera leucophlebia]|nr:hypothetical protein [Peltigera leucophlebia]
MADQNQLPRLPAMRYCPENDIPATHPGQTDRYIQGIKDALMRIELLERYLEPEERGLSSACIELAYSMKHYLQMFKEITTSIENPNRKVRVLIPRIEEIEQKLSTTILSKNLPEDGVEVPAISPYELAIRIIINSCTRAKQAKSAKDLMNEIIAKLKILYGDLGPTANQDGAPRTITFCIENSDSVKVEVLRLAMNGYVARDLRELEAQAFDGKSFEMRDRCWRCRLTFGFTWMSVEADPATQTEENVRDFEGRWQARPSESGNLNVGYRKCVEYLLWVELPPETIPLPQNGEEAFDISYASHALAPKNQVA